MGSISTRMSKSGREQAAAHDGSRLFDLQAIEYGSFKLTARAAVPIGTPTIEQWAAALEFACSAQESSPYWIGDLLNHAELAGPKWEHLMDQAVSSTGLARQTLINRGYIARHVAPAERDLAPSIKHAAEVAALTKPEQRKWLTHAKTEGWTSNELRRNVRASKRRKVIEGRAELEGVYRVFYADPPWDYGSGTKGGSKVEDHYPAMSMQQIMDLPIAAHAALDAVLFLWVTAPMLYENPGPRDIIEAWGFKAKTGMVWDKVRGIGGSYVYVRHEHLIIATRGSCLPDVTEPMIQSVVTERREGEHSAKPAGFRKAIERVYTTGPYCELFGREPVEGWTVLGNDARLWGE
jgi:N6-adenosine-specific RNA methylase IME4